MRYFINQVYISVAYKFFTTMVDNLLTDEEKTGGNRNGTWGEAAGTYLSVNGWANAVRGSRKVKRY